MHVADSRSKQFDEWTTWPEWAKDAIVLDTEVVLSWRDALRVLLRRRFSVTSKTFTAAVPGRVHTISRFYVAPPWHSRRLGTVEAQASGAGASE